RRLTRRVSAAPVPGRLCRGTVGRAKPEADRRGGGEWPWLVRFCPAEAFRPPGQPARAVWACPRAKERPITHKRISTPTPSVTVTQRGVHGQAVSARNNRRAGSGSWPHISGAAGFRVWLSLALALSGPKFFNWSREHHRQRQARPASLTSGPP